MSAPHANNGTTAVVRPATASRLRAPQAPVSIAHRSAREISDRERERIC